MDGLLIFTLGGVSVILLPVYLLVVSAHHVLAVSLASHQSLHLPSRLVVRLLLVLSGLHFLAGTVLGPVSHQCVILGLFLVLDVVVFTNI